MLLLLDYSRSGVLYVSCNNMGCRALDANKGLSRTQCYITDSSMYLRCRLSNIPDFLLEFHRNVLTQDQTAFKSALNLLTLYTIKSLKNVTFICEMIKPCS
jgi:hypothetical protein